MEFLKKVSKAVEFVEQNVNIVQQFDDISYGFKRGKKVHAYKWTEISIPIWLAQTKENQLRISIEIENIVRRAIQLKCDIKLQRDFSSILCFSHELALFCQKFVQIKC